MYPSDEKLIAEVLMTTVHEWYATLERPPSVRTQETLLSSKHKPQKIAPPTANN